jgi:hypothetical protein
MPKLSSGRQAKQLRDGMEQPLFPSHSLDGDRRTSSKPSPSTSPATRYVTSGTGAAAVEVNMGEAVGLVSDDDVGEPIAVDVPCARHRHAVMAEVNVAGRADLSAGR